MILRLYFNRSDSEFPWSVDHGSIATETQWRGVMVKAIGATVTDFTVTDRKNQPCCWIEFSNAVLREGHARYAVIE